MERQCKALALGKFTSSEEVGSFYTAYGPNLAAMGHTHIKNMCTHVQYTLYRHKGQLRFSQTLSLSLSTYSMFLKQGGLDIVLGSFVYSFI